MNKKLGILTFHYSLNEGAILQAYCLCKYLRDVLVEWDVEIIDQRYPDKIKAYNPDLNTKRGIALNNFIDTSLSLSKERFFFNNHESVSDYINKSYNALVVGSDEIWKLSYTKVLRRQTDSFFTPFPNVYWPGEEIKIPKISYAASIGQTNLPSIPFMHRRSMKRNLSSFSLLGVRDQRTVDFLEWLDPKLLSKTVLVPDPTFALDIPCEDNRQNTKLKLKELGIDFSRPKALIIANGTESVSKATDYFKSRGFQTLSLSIFNELVDVDLSKENIDPLEWSSVFAYMDVVVSSRMHGCIFSILNNIPLIAINQSFIRDSNKIIDLMESFKLQDFYFDEKKDAQNKLIHICENLTKINWPIESIEHIKSDFRKRANDFTLKVSNIIRGTKDDYFI